MCIHLSHQLCRSGSAFLRACLPVWRERVRLLTRSTFAHSQLKMWVSRTERPPHLYNRVKGLPMRIHDLVLLLTLLSVWFNKVYHFVCELLRVATLYPTEVGPLLNAIRRLHLRTQQTAFADRRCRRRCMVSDSATSLHSSASRRRASHRPIRCGVGHCSRRSARRRFCCVSRAADFKQTVFGRALSSVLFPLRVCRGHIQTLSTYLEVAWDAISGHGLRSFAGAEAPKDLRGALVAVDLAHAAGECWKRRVLVPGLYKCGPIFRRGPHDNPVVNRHAHVVRCD